jgi:hypothetical protein
VIAKGLLGAMLLAHVALAAQACVMPTFRPAAAFSGDAGMPLCEQNRPPVDVVCLAQCLQVDQAVDSPHDLVAAPPATSSASWVQLAAFASPAPSPGAATLSTGPPVYLSSHRLRL